MDSIVVARQLTKRFPDSHRPALDDVSFSLAPGTLVGLIGRNGCGKTTLLHHISGLMLPTRGQCVTLGRPTAALEAGELSAIGVVPQELRLLPRLNGRQHLRYVESFYDFWDRRLEDHLISKLELDLERPVSKLTPGQAQALAVVLAVCHRPRLLLLDEPVSALDPIARELVLGLFTRLLREDGATIVISSHVLQDVEEIVDHVLLLKQGRLEVDDSLDDLRERYAEWRISADRFLPRRFTERCVVHQEIEASTGRLIVEGAGPEELESFATLHRVHIEIAPLNLSRLFRHLHREVEP